MDLKTAAAIQNWLTMHNGDAEGLAKWMARTLGVCGIKKCRAMIAEAVATKVAA
jgi:hypothetical protein